MKGKLFSLDSLLLLLVFPLFMIVYSPILLFPNLALRHEITTRHVKSQLITVFGFKGFFYAMLPLLGLIPYFLTFVFLMD